MRIRPLLPTFLLLSTAAVLPAAAGPYDICIAAADSVNCIIEQAEFARQRNAEIDASIANVARIRAYEWARNAEIAASIAAVNAQRTRQLEIEQNALSTRVLAVANAERNRRFAAYQNKLATESVERVASLRKWELAMSTTHCKSPRSRTPRCAAERAQKFAKRQNALATASVERVQAERARQFAAARNAEIAASIAAVARNRVSLAINTTHCTGIEITPRCEAERRRELTLALTHCKSATDTSPRCAVERDRAFHIARNAEIERSLAAVARNRAATLAINTTHCTGIEITPRCAAERDRAFHIARNAEIERPLAAVAGERALQRKQAAEAMNQRRKNALKAALSAYGSIDSPLETGAIGAPELPIEPGPTPAQDLKLQHDSANEPCRPAGQPFAPLSFTKGISVDEAMVPDLDRLAGIAAMCPGVRIEVHGYSDGKGSPSTNRTNAQAGAQAVTDYLIAAGVAPNRIAAIGRGGMHSVLPYSKGERQRRVEFVIRDPGMDAVARRVMWDLAELLDPTYVPAAVAGLSP